MGLNAGLFFAAAHKGQFPLRLKVRHFQSWLAEGSPEEAFDDEYRDEAYAIIEELTEAGLIVDGHLTEDGLARLDLNEAGR